jgi:hypothetical protein
MEDWEITLIVTAIAMLALFLTLSIVFASGKGAWLISGYNTVSAEKKAKYDTQAMCKFMSWFSLAVAVAMPTLLLACVFEIWWLAILATAAFVGLTIFVIVYANTGNRFKKCDSEIYTGSAGGSDATS